MKTKALKIFLVFTFLLIDFVSFANPGNDNVDGTLEGDDEAPTATVPINGKLIWLAIIGIAFAYYSFKKKRLSESVK